MKFRARPSGYTIVEVMIFLAISGALLGSAMLLINGQQAKTQFQQAINDFNSQLQDILNDVSTGFYPSANFSCSAAAAGAPIFSGGATGQGSNTGCIFIGKVIQFSPSGSADKMDIYSVAGRQFKANSSNVVDTFAEALPTANTYDIDSQTFQDGLSVKSVTYPPGGAHIGAVGFFSDFGQYASSGGNLLSGTRTVNLVALPNSQLGDSGATTQTQIAALKTADGQPYVNPGSGILICIDGGPNEYGEITIGSNNRQLSTELAIKQGSCP